MNAEPTPTPDQVDAHAAHEADRAPTAEEERLAEAAAEDVDPLSGEEYERSIERGAAVKGEGQISPEEPS